ncbi:insulinase family protein [Cronobacter dublinensis]|uniref:insulinase family protein n=1 Tax=Cronobacter dublinensis TaxID=413497 RepID=UPI001F18D9EB|nr:insulinase family protein [Cronobacter dublinensis]
MTRTLRLENGVTLTLIHQPQATQAAALWRVNAGSLHEPDAWPGLAHLLEHMLFRGSDGYPDDERLMRWVPDQGGRLNASTRLCQTAFFFEAPAQRLSPAFAPYRYAGRPAPGARGADAGDSGD